jgi:putative MATE family efflux protein
LEDSQGHPQTVEGAEVEFRPEFTSGNVSGHVLRLALPSMLAMLFHSSYYFFDMIWLGMLGRDLGKQAQAAVTTYMIFWMLLSIFNQLVAMGSFTLIARSYGAKNYEETSTVIGQTIIFKLLFALPAAVLGYFFIYDAYVWYGTTKQVAVLGSEYGRVMLIALPIYFTGFTLNTGFRSIGDVKKPMYLAAATMGLNIALDPLFILGAGSWQGWGVAGAAYASFISQVIFFIAGMYIFVSGRTYVRLSMRHLARPSLGWIVKFIKIGSPAVVGDASRFTAQFVVGRIITSFGTTVLAAFGIGMQLFQMAWIPLFGIDSAVNALVGQNLGADKPDRAEQSTLWGTLLSVRIMAVVAVLALVFAKPFVGIFTEDGGVIVVGANLLRVGAFTIMFISVSSGLAAAFWGSGHTVPLAILSVISLWGVQVPAVFLFVKGFGTWVNHVWASALIAEFASCILAVYLFSRGGWKHKKV